MMKKYIVLLLIVLLAVPGVRAGGDDDDKTTVHKREIRRLHPERERLKAMKKLQEQRSRKAEPKDDPWDTSDEVWGTVDVPPDLRDSTAVEGHRLTSPPTAGANGQRLVWRDEPVTSSIDQLMPYCIVDDDGDCRSKYVSVDEPRNEVYFTFAVNDSLTGPLRLCVRYLGETPMDFDQLVFTIDGFDYMFYPTDVQHGLTDSGSYWSISDNEVHPAYKDLVYALAHGHWGIMKMQGSGGVSLVKMLTDGQRDDFARTLALYLLLGGSI
jgi:hypothetical protein